jgi:hypothetical protein
MGNIKHQWLRDWFEVYDWALVLGGLAVYVLLAAVVFPDWQESNVVLPVCEDPGKRR